MSGEAKPVVVGVDESPASRGSLRWAVREARMRHTRLLVVHALSAADSTVERAEGVADEALSSARALAPEVSMDALVDDERVAGRALCRLSRDATLIVVGSRGLGGFSGLLLGSVSSYAATHAECPVLVVHGGERWAGPEAGDRSALPVLVGIGPYGRPAAAWEPLLDFAFAEAHMRGVELLALRAWNPPPPPWRSDVRPLVADVAELETSERLDLTEATLPYRHKVPDVTVRQRVTPVGAAAALVDAAAHAQLVVVGSRHGRAAGLRLGSVSQQVLHHAPSPVAIVPMGAADRSKEPGGAS
jgi:nucleotide-binding universal stress UspA family protein